LIGTKARAWGSSRTRSRPKAGHLRTCTQDETHYILEGQFEFVLGERKVDAGAGSVVYVPRTTMHAFTNTGTKKGKLLFIDTPAGPLEQFLVEFGEPVSDPSSPPEGELDLDKLRAIAQRTGGIEFG
jgi:hypothetical protein